MAGTHSTSTRAIVTAALCALVAAMALFAPGLPLWALDSWSYLSAGQIAAVLLAAALLTYAAARAPGLSGMNLSGSTRLALGLLFSVGLVALFYWLSSATYLYGDGYVRTAEIVEKGKWLRFTEPLDTLLRQLVYRFTHLLFGWDGYQAARLISIVCGVLYFWLALWGTKFVSTDPRQRGLSVALLCATGLVALFFGYVETYPTSVVACLAFLLVALGVLRGCLRGWVMILLFLVAVMLHTSMLTFAPALAVVLARSGRKRWSVAVGITAAIVAALAVLIFLISVLEHAGGYPVALLEFVLIPLTPGSGYWLFAADHLTDIVNEYLLVAPAALLLLPLVQFSKKKADSSERFLLLATLLGFGFALLFNTHLGFARDWDLFAFLGLPLTLLVAHLLTRAKSPHPIAWLPIGIGFAVTGAFVLLLADENAAVARFSDITERYQQGRAYNYETLSTYYISKRQYNKALTSIERAEQTSRNARYPHQIGALQLMLNQPLQATESLKRSLAIDSTMVNNYPLLVDAYTRLRNYDSTMTYLKQAVDYLPQGASPEDYYQVAGWLRQQGGGTSAADYFEQSLLLCDQALQERPADFRRTLLAIRCEVQLADSAAAQARLDRLLSQQPPAEIRIEALTILGHTEAAE